MDNFKEGMRLPTLIKQLQRILEQYPDDGQILKELIQNAEDAGVSGATQIKFLIDYSSYGTETLHQDDLKDFQGPALYVYNDALFTEDDWDGIRSLHESIKEDDPMKVGRFGLGFKSVFHLTDLPSIFSDKGIGFIDPHMRYFEREVKGKSYKEKTSCFLFNLEQDHEIISDLADQFAPFCQEVFGISRDTILEQKRFQGTLFRFPFRTQKNLKDSEICKTVYDKKKVESLIQSLITDSHNSLLFLRNLEQIEVYEKSEEGDVKLKFKVAISDGCRDWVREKRMDFVKQMNGGTRWTKSSSVKVTYPIAFDITKYSSDGQPIKDPETWWIVTQYFAGEEDVGQEKIVQDNRYLPLVGVAQKLNFNQTDGPIAYNQNPNGHIFCFLPLPMEQESPTGFRVHVNGAFAVDHNRRHIKWAPSDLMLSNIADTDLKWNLFLVSKVLPKAFKAQLLYMVSLGRRAFDAPAPDSFIAALNEETPEFLSQHIYAVVPEPKIVKSQWQGVVQCVIGEIKNISLFYTPTGNGKYLNYMDAIFDMLDENKSASDKALDLLLRKILIEDERNIVCLPSYMYKMLPKGFNEANAVQAIESLKSVQDDLDISDKDGIKLLNYCFLDSSKIPYLTGVRLLPLADGTWTTFKNKPDEDALVYCESDQHRQEFLPGLERLFLRKDGLSSNTLSMLKMKGNSVSTQYQLRELTAAKVAEFLPEVFNTGEWPSDRDDFDIPKNHTWFDEDWLEMMWAYLEKHYNRNLERFETLPIVPLSNDKVTRLSSTSAIVAKSALQRGTREQLSIDKLNLCENLGIKIMKADDSEILKHQYVWKNYIQPPNDAGIMKAIFRVSQNKDIVALVDSLDQQYISTLRTILVEAVKTMSIEEIEIVKSLRVFKAILQNCKVESNFVSILDTKIALPANMRLLPLTCSVIALDLSDEISRKLANSLGVSIPNRPEFIMQIYIPHIQSDSSPLEDRKIVIRYLLENWTEMSQLHYTECSSLAATVHKIQFITTTNGSLVRPVDTYDSTSNKLKTLFSDFDVFAADEFAAPRCSDIMKIFGVKDEDYIGNDEVLSIARRIDKFQDERDKKRSEELMKFLNGISFQRVGKNQKIDMNSLKDELSQLRWVFTSGERPENYPKLLFYVSEKQKFASPSEVLASQFACIVGSVQPVLQANELSNLANLFLWKSNPSIDKIAQHLSKAVDTFSIEEQTANQNTARAVYQHLQKNVSDIPRFLEYLGDRPWIWHGEGFALAKQMAFNAPPFVKPHCYELPAELRRSFTELWIFCNIPQQCQLPDILEKIKMHHESETSISEPIIRRDINLCYQILQEIVATENQIPETLLIPIKTTDGRLQMKEKKGCAYCDEQWFKSGLNNMDLAEDIDVVHSNIPIELCNKLKIDSLVSKTVGAEELDMSYGQSEDLTRRLNDILRGYNDGLAVFKELIQNADDAGAKKIHFLYDERDNGDARDILLDPGMAELQGPALWIYNDAEFSEVDFENITKISSASKEHDTGKVGRFGVGFNVVYNITDVPMFVSNKYIAIFDPHTKYLGNMIKDKSKPGIRLDLARRRRQIQRVSHQFKPFDKIFHCDFSPSSEMTRYTGTLFRLPLRTAKQAASSEICDIAYSNAQVMELIGLLSNAGHQLLLYTQTLQKISVSHLSRNASPPNDTQLWFSISKHTEKIIRNPDPTIPVLKQASIKISEIKQRPNSRLDLTSADLEVSVLLKITTDYSDAAPKSLAESEKTSHWLVVSCLGKGESMTLALNGCGSLIPLGGAAAKLSKISGDIYEPVSVSDGQRQGTIFCFMPLPISTTFPVHINGYFEVHSSRTHIYDIVANDKESQRGVWNKALLQDAVARAYIILLEHLTSLCGSQSCYELWPAHRSLNEIGFLSNLTEAFYKIVCSENIKAPCIFSHQLAWANFCESRMLETSFREEEISETVLSVIESLYKLIYAENFKSVDLPIEIQRTIFMTSSENALKSHLTTKDEFYALFLSNICSVEAISRDKLLINALLDKTIRDSLKDALCIPVSPNGLKFKAASETIDPRSKLSVLFDPEDECFPCFTNEEYDSKTDDIFSALAKIGMKNDSLTWEEIYNRCISVHENSSKSSKRTPVIMALIEEKLDREEYPDPSLIGKISKINFIKPAVKSQDYPLKWKGNESRTQDLIAIEEGYLKSHEKLVSCSCFIIDEAEVFGGRLCQKTKELFGLTCKRVATNVVVDQLLEISKLSDNSGHVKQHADNKEIWSIYEDCLVSLNQYAISNPEISSKLADLQSRNIILIEARGHLLKPQQCATATPNDSYDLFPYLAKISENKASRFNKIYQILGVRDKFEISDFCCMLEAIQQEANNEKLNSWQLHSAIAAIGSICALIEQSSDKTILINHRILVPNCSEILCDSKELCYNCSWLDDDRGNFCHSKISSASAKLLGLRPLQAELLRENRLAMKFGQREELVKRINRLLDTYLCDETILKELLQNADDAGATEIQFILDTRHLPDEKVFQESWKLLQGPALCVYNNKSFTKADIEGIQKLGEGSKEYDLAKTGQFGVGFNSVYNLTDVPSFLTKTEDTGTTLCVFDPNCSYVPEADESSPGGMYKVAEVLTKFPDVFQGYLQDIDEYNVSETGTVFRLPLRTAEMKNKYNSRIKAKPITIENMKLMFKKFMDDMYEMLLFVHNVRSISVKEITEEKDGKINIKTLYKVDSRISPAVQEMICDFEMHTRDWASKTQLVESIQLPDASVEPLQCKEIIYEMETLDSEKSDIWQIVQRFGFSEGFEVPSDVVTMLKSDELKLLPRGGVAYLKHRNNDNDHIERKSRYFCYLPIPGEIDIPVNLNGHFVLSSEARRGIWTDKKSPLKLQWNTILMQGIIAPAYCSLLKQLNTELRDKSKESKNILGQIHKYLQAFPIVKKKDTSLLSEMAKSLYATIWNNNLPLFPVRNETKSSGEIKWSGPRFSSEGIAAYFNDLSDQIKDEDDSQGSTAHRTSGSFVNATPKSKTEKEPPRFKIVEATLCRCGMYLLACSLRIYKNFKNSEIKALTVSPDSVLEFLKEFAFGDRGKFPSLPAPISETPIVDTKSLEELLKYCATADKYKDKLQNVPLLVTYDEVVHTFDANKIKYRCRYEDIAAHAPDEFIHPTVYSALKLNTESDTQLCQDLTLDDFINVLTRTLPSEEFSGTAKRISLKLLIDRMNTAKTPYWLSSVWRLLYSLCKIRSPILSCTFSMSTEKSKEEEARHAQEVENLIINLKLVLSSWCLIPITFLGEKMLVSLDKAESLLSTSGLLTLTHFTEKNLSKLGCAFVLEQSVGETGMILVRRLIGSLERPLSVSLALGDLVEYDANAFSEIKPSDSAEILQYFSKYIKPEEITLMSKNLKKLPFYETIQKTYVSPGEAIVYIVPKTIPSSGMEALSIALNVIYLKKEESLDNLHKLLGFRTLSIASVYYDHIFEHFQVLSSPEKEAHLNYIKTHVSAIKSQIQEIEWGLTDLSPAAKEDKLLLLQNDLGLLRHRLCKLKFIPCPTGDSQYESANYFYDRRNHLFSVMEDTSRFLPEPYCDENWLDFIKDCGLNHEVSDEKFILYARQIEISPVSGDTKQKSDEMMKHFLSKCNTDINEYFLTQLKGIKFITTYKVNDDISEIHPQFGLNTDHELQLTSFQGSTLRDHSKLVWSSQCILPLSYHDLYFTIQNKRLQHLEDICRNLEVDIEPSQRIVANHVKLLCQNLKLNSMHFVKNCKDPNLLMEVFETLYKYLCKKLTKDILEDKTKRILRNTCCVLIPDIWHLISAEQLAIELPKQDQIEPYLYGIPRIFGPFEPLFRELGATENANVYQYAQVLKHIFNETKGKSLDENRRNAVMRALSKYVELSLVSREDDCHPESDLYLPCRNGILYHSSETLFVDNILMFPLIDFEEIELEKPVLVNFAEIGIDHGKIASVLSRLPNGHRPQYFSQLVTEELVGNEPEIESQFVVKVRDLLESDALLNGLYRIIKPSGHHVSDEDMDNLCMMANANVKKINLVGRHKVRTRLIYKGRALNTEVKERWYFVDESVDGIVTVYIKQDFTGNVKFYSHLAMLLCRNIEDNDGKKSRLMTIILECSKHDIEQALDEEGVNPYISLSAPFIAPLGSLVPYCDHHLLIQSVFILWPNMIVAYEIDDSIDEDGSRMQTFKLVKVLEIMRDTDDHDESSKEINRESAPLMTKYKIQCSESKSDVKIVQASLLYAFSCEKRPVDVNLNETGEDTNANLDSVEAYRWTVLLYEGDATEPAQERSEPDLGFSDAIKVIKAKLKAIFAFSDQKERERLIKRLYLEYHPDKNKPEQKDLYTKIFQRLQNLIRMLESGKSIDDPIFEDENSSAADQSTPSSNSSRYNDDFFNNMNHRARQHHQQWNWYNQPGNKRRRNRRRYNNGHSSGWTSGGSGNAGNGGGGGGGGGCGWSGSNNANGWNERSNQQALFRSFVTDENSQPGEARRWMKQAKRDLDASINDGCTAVLKPALEWKSYKAYMAAQKSLQGAQYAKDCNKIKIVGNTTVHLIADKPSSLKEMCENLDNPRLTDLATKMDALMHSGGADRLQYPCLHEMPAIPSDTVIESQADKIQSLAQEIYNACNEFIVQCADFNRYN